MIDNDDDNPSDPGWVKKGTGLWKFTGKKGEENPYKEIDEMTDEEYAKHEEHLQQMEKDKIKRLKKMGCLPEAYDDDRGCPGCGESILPRHHDEFMKKSFMHAECSVCNVGFTDTTQEYTELFQYSGTIYDNELVISG
jgi:hypothetical protein